MGTVDIQGDLWSQAPAGWAQIQEPMNWPLWEAMLDAALVGRDTRLLDAGCGAGGATVLAERRGAVASGIDAAPGLLAFARTRLARADVCVGDMASLPYADDVFDAVFAANAIQFTAAPVATLREFERVCAPGGRIVAGLFGPPEKVAYRAILKAVAATLPTPPSGGGPFALSLPGVLENLFATAGLTVLASGEVNAPYHYRDAEELWFAVAAAGPVQGALRVVDEAKLKQAVLQAVAPYRRDDGTFLIDPNVFIFVVAEQG